MECRYIGKAIAIAYSLRGSVQTGIIHLLSSSVLAVGLRWGCFCAVCNASVRLELALECLRREDLCDRMVQDGFIGLVAPARLSVVRPSSQSVQEGSARVMRFLDAQFLKAVTSVERAEAS
jgi:hypothetical protein